MEESTNPTNDTKKTVVKKKQVLKKLDPDTTRLLQSIKDKINRKTHGRKIKDVEIILKGLSLITAEHIAELQSRTLSERDHLNIAHESFQKSNGKLSLDQFIGKLLKGEIRNN